MGSRVWPMAAIPTPSSTELERVKVAMELEIALPRDIALHIVSSLQDTDVCSLGSCSRFWRRLCGSDALWFALAKRRWPSVDVPLDGGGEDEPVGKSFYIELHKVMADRATQIAHFVNEHSKSQDSLEGAYYLRAVGEICLMGLSFRDIQLFFFNAKQNVLLNLIGLHYCLFCLGISGEDVSQALSSCHISDRQFCVRWWKLGRWVHGFRLRDESQSRRVSLRDIVDGGEEKVVGVLQRGAVHEVLRVQISVCTESSSWLRI